MGIREDQYIGLPQTAVAFLDEQETAVQICTCCNRPFPRDLQVVGHYHGMFDTEYPLYRHALKDGRVADEFLQASPWDCGPMFFLGLEVSDGTRFEWTEEEIEQGGCTAAEAATDVEIEEGWQEWGGNADGDNIIDAEFEVKESS
jgi:hypothetical protein